MHKWGRDATWWKTFDYLSGHTYILAEKFTGKTSAMAYARQCGMAVLPQSTTPISDLERENILLKKQIEEMKKQGG